MFRNETFCLVTASLKNNLSAKSFHSRDKKEKGDALFSHEIKMIQLKVTSDSNLSVSHCADTTCPSICSLSHFYHDLGLQ